MAETLANRDQRIMRWIDSYKALAQAKETEMALRKELFGELFPNAVKGTNTLDLGNGYKVKGVKGFNYKLENKEGQTDAMLDAFEKQFGAEGKFIAERLVKFDPRLSISEYDKLTDAQRKVVDKVLTVSDASPTLEMVEPKKK